MVTDRPPEQVGCLGEKKSYEEEKRKQRDRPRVCKYPLVNNYLFLDQDGVSEIRRK